MRSRRRITKPKTPSVDEIIADARVARQALSDMEQQLQEEIDKIDFAAFREKRDLTAAEIDRRKELRATQGEVRDGFTVLVFMTAERLDNSDEVSQLLRRLQVINAGLEDDLEQLRKVVKFAKLAAQVASALEKAAGNLARLAAGALP
jgi:hypothetical protein